MKITYSFESFPVPEGSSEHGSGSVDVPQPEGFLMQDWRVAGDRIVVCWAKTEWPSVTDRQHSEITFVPLADGKPPSSERP